MCFHGNAQSDEYVREEFKEFPFLSNRTGMVTVRYNSKVAFVVVNFMFQHKDRETLIDSANDSILHHAPALHQKCVSDAAQKIVNKGLNQVIYAFGD